MDWTQVLTIIVANFGLFLWIRSEGNSDRREHAADRRDILSMIREIKDEMKDFHGRLCAIEERNKKC